LEKLFQMAAREECQQHPHQWMVTIRPEKRKDPLQDDTIACQQEEGEHDAEHAEVTKPAHALLSFIAMTYAEVH
jgi:hypothetical protein